MKCAGSSIEKALLEYCTKDALCTGGMSISFKAKAKILEKGGTTGHEFVEYDQRNNILETEEIETECKRSAYEVKFHAHTDPKTFYLKIKNKDIFDNFKKITVVRNPWDQLISFYWWSFSDESKNNNFYIKKDDSKSKSKKKFKIFLNEKFKYTSYIDNINRIIDTPIAYVSNTNQGFIGKPMTHYIKYENIDVDYETIFSNILFDNKLKKLPNLKSDIKKIDRHYSFYYDYETRRLVEKAFRKTIDKFNYKFERG
jgi:hypothetical protein